MFFIFKVDKIKARLASDSSIPAKDFQGCLDRYKAIKDMVLLSVIIGGGVFKYKFWSLYDHDKVGEAISAHGDGEVILPVKLKEGHLFNVCSS